MSNIITVEIAVVDSEAGILLESLQHEMEWLKRINATSEDEAIDAGNNYIEVSSLYEKIKKKSILTLGKQRINGTVQL
ncbi:MAG: hypothetical protein ACJAWS_003310 [Oleiphilaceae bacterium]|jgi:hypothetical protein